MSYLSLFATFETSLLLDNNLLDGKEMQHAIVTALHTNNWLVDGGDIIDQLDWKAYESPSQS
jgi:hypothetical protein